MKTATELIKKERFEQTNKHGYSAQHDDEVNDRYQLQIAAEAIIDADCSRFPAGWDLALVQKMCDKPPLERLVIAGAFYSAEQERVDRKISAIKRGITQILDNTGTPILKDFPKCRYCDGKGCQECDYFGIA